MQEQDNSIEKNQVARNTTDAAVTARSRTKTGFTAPLTSNAMHKRVPAEVERILRASRPSDTGHPGGMAALRQALSLIAKSGPLEIRPVANQALELLPEEGNILLSVDDYTRMNMHGAVTLVPLPHLYLFTAEGRRGLDFDTVIHESFHIGIALRYGTLKDELGRLKRTDSSHVDTSPTIAFAQFARLWEEFRTVSSDEKFADADLGIAVSDARVSPDEFFVRSLTDAKFQSYLSEKRYEGKTLWSRLKQWVKTNLLKVPRTEPEPSWLDAALVASSDLASALSESRANKFYSTPKPAPGPAEVQTETEQFKQWFGASKVVTRGTLEPLVVYHGSLENADIRRFSIANSEMDFEEREFYFTSNRDHAESYATDLGEQGLEHGGSVYPVFLKMENPAEVTSDDWNRSIGPTPHEARLAGHDGFIIRGQQDGDTYIAFDPQQITSAVGNGGSFDVGSEKIDTTRSRTQEGSPEFKAWFSESKVVDDDFHPIVMYHGSKARFRVFNTDTPQWFTKDRSYAQVFADEKGFVVSAYLQIRNPVYVGDIDGVADEEAIARLSRHSGAPKNSLQQILAASGGGNIYHITNTRAFKELMAQHGFDGIEAKEARGRTTFAVFRPNQVKSAIKNEGKFDPENPSIYKSRALVQEQSPEFKAWFRNSAVVDDAGRPMPVYHGSHDKFTVFEPRISEEWIGPGMNDTKEVGRIYLTTNRKTARSYGKHVTQAYVSLQDPFVFDADGKSFNDVIPAAYISEALQGGHDGIIVKNIRDGARGYGTETLGDTIIVFDPTQIKSATNNIGTFDPTVEDINMSRSSAQVTTPEFRNWFGSSIARSDDGQPLILYHGTNAHAYIEGQINAFNTSPPSGRGAAFFTNDINLANQYGQRTYAVYLNLRNPLIVYGDGKNWTNLSGESRIGGVPPSALRAASQKAADELTKLFAEMGDMLGETGTTIARPKISDKAAALDGMKLGDLPGLDQTDLETDAIVKAARKFGFDGVVFRGIQDSPTSDSLYDKVVSDVYAVFRPEQIKSAVTNSGAFALESPDINMSRGHIQESTTEFRAWFNGSKVIDPEGAPLMVHHGTNCTFLTFDDSKLGNRDPGFFGKGFYFTPDRELAHDYADSAVEDAGDGNSNVVSAYIALRNPFVWDMSDAGCYKTIELLSEFGIKRSSVRGDANALGNSRERDIFNKEARARGYDGVIVQDEDGVREVVAFSSNQIKSATGNIGSFDPTNPSILSSKARLQEASNEFIKWFDGSIVKDDETNSPIVMYHGTDKTFDAFNTSGRDLGSHFGSIDQATQFTHKDNAHVIPVYLSIRNPIRLEDRGGFEVCRVGVQLVDAGVLSPQEVDDIAAMSESDASNFMQSRIIAAGYDGVVYLNRREGFDPFGPDGVDGETLDAMTDGEVLDTFPDAHDSYIAFYPQQIKSAVANFGTFSPTDPNILLSRAAESIEGQPEARRVRMKP